MLACLTGIVDPLATRPRLVTTYLVQARRDPNKQAVPIVRTVPNLPSDSARCLPTLIHIYPVQRTSYNGHQR